MRRPTVDDHVRLTHDVPDLSLQRGQVGVVCSLWFAPAIAYDVEFESPDNSGHIRAMLDEWDFQLEDQSAVEAGRAI